MKKRFIKKLTMSIASVCLTLLIAVGFAFSPAASVAADTVYYETISVGETTRQSWTAEDGYIEIALNVQETDFYSITVTDHNQTGLLLAYITDYTSYQMVDMVYNDEISETISSGSILLTAGNEYVLMCEYYEYIDESFNYLPADMTIQFNEAFDNVQQLPEGELSSSNLQYEYDEEENTLVCEYTTAAAGDYSLYFSDLHAFVTVYNAQTGEEVTSVDSEYVYSYGAATGAPLYKVKDKLIFNLNANTKYYFEIWGYEPAVTKLSMSKNSKTVRNIVAKEAASEIYCWDSVNETSFNYKITYTNGTSETKSYLAMASAGFNQPIVLFLGEYVDINGESLLKGGKTSVVSLYDIDESDLLEIETMADLINMLNIIYVDVQSLTDWLIDIDVNAVGEYDSCVVEYNGTDVEWGYFRFKVDKTGYYCLQSDYTFAYNLDRWSVVFVDEYNNIVNFDENEMAWPLVAGREYAIEFLRQFKQYPETYELTFEFAKTSNTIYSDVSGGAWYHDAVTYVTGRGIMTGYGGTTKFGTADGIQRQDFLVMLARFSGADLSEYENMHGIFPDVEKGSYYEAAVNWGYANGIVTGYENGRFGTGDKITREQIVTFLYRYAYLNLSDASYSYNRESIVSRDYTDYKNVTDFAKEPILWAIEKGVISGKTSTTIVPQGNAQRCEVAQMMFNIFKNDII